MKNSKQINTSEILTAIENLQEIIIYEEKAVTLILDEISELQENIDNKKQISICLTKICEACTFQDISAQRIKKVINLLSHLGAETSISMDNYESKKDFLEGPQLSKNLISQDKVDEILKGNNPSD